VADLGSEHLLVMRQRRAELDQTSLESMKL
jgi:hypothetical protein